MAWRLRGLTMTTVLLPVPEAGPAARMLAPAVLGETQTHLTLAYPFPRTAMGAGTRNRLAEVFAGMEPFDLVLSEIATFDNVAYLAPADPSAVISIADALHGAFPGHPLYGGAYASYIPHVAIGPVERLTDEVRTRVARLLPIVRRSGHAELWALRHAGWRWAASFPLGDSQASSCSCHPLAPPGNRG